MMYIDDKKHHLHSISITYRYQHQSSSMNTQDENAYFSANDASVCLEGKEHLTSIPKGILVAFESLTPDLR
eukprot:TRINITY_DN1460_c0_g1_i2.p1 TRINITY_DN1460_c0_g1~~TRINITY_DN1460_c0_g1_i2.p1  ORF type:complete len:71 (+),score=2.76 TRINITY_DN1460_c0_g1_i2:224-436(+)